MKLNDLRKKIDDLDSKILNLLNRRAKIVLDIAKIKKKNNFAVLSADREASLMRNLKKINQGPLKSEDIDYIFNEILSVSRSLQLKLKVSFLGPLGTFTHLAAVKKFGKKIDLVACQSIGEVFSNVEKEAVEYGVVPIENSIEGVVNHTLDMFLESDLKICSEITMNISHSFLRSSDKDEVKTIYSHPQVLAQCRQWILKYYPSASLVSTASTAKAAEITAKKPSSACIGNRVLADLYDLKVIKTHIEDSSSNMTRFLVISKEDSNKTGRDKSSLLFSVKDKVGVLHDVLNIFKKNKINLTKIESRPSKQKPWQYCFFVDIQGHRNEAKVKKALASLQKETVFLKIMGSYPKEN